MVYTHENRFFVANARNIVESTGIRVFLKNEYTSSIMGEAAAFDTWVELWVENSADYNRACDLIANSLSEEDAEPWRCAVCDEENDAAFELCWQCAHDRC